MVPAMAQAMVTVTVPVFIQATVTVLASIPGMAQDRPIIQLMMIKHWSKLS